LNLRQLRPEYRSHDLPAGSRSRLPQHAIPRPHHPLHWRGISVSNFPENHLLVTIFPHLVNVFPEESGSVSYELAGYGQGGSLQSALPFPQHRDLFRHRAQEALVVAAGRSSHLSARLKSPFNL